MFLPHGCSERFLNTLVKYLPKRFSMNWSFREHFPYSSDLNTLQTGVDSHGHAESFM